MKITKFEQSCLLLEKDGARLLIDPGYLSAHRIKEWGGLDAVLFTHEHPDHFDKDAAEKLAETTEVYVNKSTAAQLAGPKKIVKNGDDIAAGNFKIKTVELPHCLMPDGSEGPQNVGYLIDELLFHPGDGIELEGLSVKYLALPITGPDVSPRRAFQFARQVSAEKALAVHYDTFGANTDYYQDRAKATNQPFELIVLLPGQSTEV